MVSSLFRRKLIRDADLLKRVALRFARVFVGGFVAALVVQLQQKPEVVDIHTFLNSLLFAGITGGLLAMDKLLRK